MRKYVILAGLILSATRLSAGEALLEYQVKAVCVLNTARFVTWPGSAFGNAGSPLVIGIIGDNPFGSALEDVVAGETLHERRIVIRRVALEEAATVHILFISNSQRDRVGAILRAVDNGSVLTISEIERFTQSGGMLGLALDHGKIRFEINSAAVKRTELKIDAQFLLMARGR